VAVGVELAPLSEGMRAPVVFDSSELHDSIAELIGEQGFDFINRMLMENAGQTLFLATTTRFNIQTQPKGVYKNIVNLRRINDIPRINKFFEEVNARLPDGGVFIDCVETTGMRRERIMAKFPPMINSLYYFMDYIFKRVFPKLPVTKEIYFFLTRGNNRVLSKSETFGRLYSCGFELLEEQRSDNLLFFAARKVNAPVFDMQPTYGPLIRLRRHGKNGAIISVYKMRTMHPFSEYLQEYMFKRNHLAAGGKIANDFRVTTVGSFMRRFWLDELPMLINLLKGDLKLVGVRPLSKHYFSLYPEEMRQRRSRYRPGLIPPFYVDMPKSLDQVIASERRYLDLYDKHPFRTDWIYFWKAMWNIFVKHARSR
jgi:lipopolysaccharide/colanic/teichoic acid biosynthesis glycosyltransferase